MRENVDSIVTVTSVPAGADEEAEEAESEFALESIAEAEDSTTLAIDDEEEEIDADDADDKALASEQGDSVETVGPIASSSDEAVTQVSLVNDAACSQTDATERSASESPRIDTAKMRQFRWICIK